MKSRQDFESEITYKEYIRTYFAARAMQGMLSNSALNYGDSFDAICQKAITCADIILSELEKT